MLARAGLERAHLLGFQHRRERGDRLTEPAGGHELRLHLGRGVPEREPHEEPVQLGVGQGIGPGEIEGVLGRHHDERAREEVRRPVHRDVRVRHRLEQRGLRARRCPVQLVGEHELVEQRTGTELELAARGREDLHPGDVGGHEVGGELDAGEAEAAHPRQPLGERGLPHAGRVLHEQVPSGDEGGQRELDGGALAADDAPQGLAGPGEQRVRCGGGERRTGEGGGGHVVAGSLAAARSFTLPPAARAPRSGARNTRTSVPGVSRAP
jgi:hypothetical protein